ncbi:hypothetical protein ACTXOY_01230 [Corynebacterium variabile]|uniref:hypothetical protein n=1 Tax=Corynebacterium variabile TaxID=1727 RepID=UPI003FD0C1B0
MYIKMMNEYSVDWPFWNPAGRNPDLDLPYLLSDMDDPLPHLPDDLAAQVRSWTRQFAENYERNFRWPSQEMARAHEEEGRRLHAEVTAALPVDTVVLDYWETGYADDAEDTGDSSAGTYTH